MPKKQNTRRKDGLIAVQVYLGMDENKKRKYKTVYGSTQKEANAKAEQIKLSLRKGIDVSSEKDTFKEWGERLLKIKKSEVSHGRYCTYCHEFEKLSPLFLCEISKIRTSDIQGVILDLSESNPNTNKPTAKKTLIDIKCLASQIFKLAIENRVLDYNPALAVKIPNIHSEDKRRALTAEEQKWIVETPHRAQTAAMIMMYAGLRRGELIPLTWDDIDLSKKTISVNKTVEIINNKSIEKDTAKTKLSIRTVDIPNVLVEYLKSVKKSSKYVCPSADNKMMSESSYKRMWDSYIKELNLKYGDFSHLDKQPKSKFQPGGVPIVIPKITAHWLRHTFATMLYFAGVDILTAKEQLGHSDIKTTLEIYTHLDNQFKRKSMNKLDEYLSQDKNQNMCG
jgi:integrase